MCGPLGESPNTENKNTRKDEHQRSTPSGKQDFSMHTQCMAQGSVDETESGSGSGSRAETKSKLNAPKYL